MLLTVPCKLLDRTTLYEIGIQIQNRLNIYYRLLLTEVEAARSKRASHAIMLLAQTARPDGDKVPKRSFFLLFLRILLLSNLSMLGNMRCVLQLVMTLGTK